MQPPSQPEQTRDRVGSLPDAVITRADLSSLVAALLPDWAVLDSVAIASWTVFVLRHPESGDWALGRLPHQDDFPADLLAADPSAQPRDYDTTVRWAEATLGQRRLMLTRQDHAWTIGADLMGLWQTLAYAYDAHQHGRDTGPGGLVWADWLAVGWRLTMQHPDGVALRQQDWVQMMLGLALQADLVRHAWSEAEQALRSSVFDFAIAAVGAQTRAANLNWPLRFGHVQAINDIVYDRLIEDYLPEVRVSHATIQSRTPETDPDRTLHDYPTPAEVDRAVAEVLATFDWRALDDDRFTAGR